MKIEFVNQLYEFAKDKTDNKPIMAILPDKTEIIMSPQFYIENDVYYMSTDDEGSVLTAPWLLKNIINESTEPCWNENPMENTLGNCDVIFINGDVTNSDAKSYVIDNIIETDTAYHFIMSNYD